jgi:aryl-alcohol dehydrogenase-like predicted oxidoreductase
MWEPAGREAVIQVNSQTFALAGRPVHRVGFGAMQLPGPGVFGPPKDHDQAIAVLRRAVAAGVNHIDTAQFYGPDVANELIREALSPYPADLVLVSKVGGARDDQVLGQLRLGQVSAEGHASRRGEPEENDLDRVPTPPPASAA